MALNDPIAVYNALNNVEAQLIANFLNDAGVEAYALADVSQVGVWLFGLMPEIHKPQVWVNRDMVPQAAELLQEYERRQSERRHPERAAGKETIEAVCDECGQPSSFPQARRGTVQDCPHCGKMMDVEDASSTEPWWDEAGTQSDASDVE